MTTIPTRVSLDQRRAVARTLGLPAALLRTVTVDADQGVTATLFVKDREGRTIRHGDGPLTTTVHIPCGDERQEVNTS
ncbi:hypothetical protein ACFWPY_07935 [Streptomyces sp. NPDC058527]|uniref:hypothetical protein n=1 Tax=unclassified Streptomyces TaxID=2593676 RepID=UPI00364FF0F9